MRLSFHGADRDVTGSCHLIEGAGKRILIDCGLFQGTRALFEENAQPFGFDPVAIDFVLLTHAHLDHCGRLPLLAKRGFRGEIITTGATRELARLVMLDAAHLQEEEDRAPAAGNALGNQHLARSAPLYSLVDALRALDGFGRTAEYGARIALDADSGATFFDAGHILGSASILLEIGESTRVLFSGDIGNAGRPLLRPPATPPKAEIVVIEATYGDRLHKPIGPSIEELYAVVSATLGRGGNVIIPTFGLERAQELLYVFSRGVETGQLPPTMQVYLDSPMAISATEIFARHPEGLQPNIAALIDEGRDPFYLPGLHYVRERGESIALNQIRGGAVIMAGSGMATGGRVRHHLMHNLARPESGVIFVGFASKGTPARQIIDGAKFVHLFGEEIAVRASIHTINGFSAHADQAELLAWHRQTGAGRTFLTHGEENTMQNFAAKLANTRVEMPMLHQTYEL